MKKKHAILALTIGVLLVGLVPVVQAKTTHRPIEDWLNAQWDFFYDFFGYDMNNYGFSDFVSPHSWLIVKMGWPFPFPWLPNFLDENGLVVGETTFDGHITERVVKDGRTLVTVNLFVNNGPLTVYDFWEFREYIWFGGPRPSAILGSYEDGYIDYHFIYKFYVDEPGQPLPWAWDIWEYESVHIVGTGYGILTEHAADFGYTPGAMGMLKLHQLALYKPDFDPEHPKYDPFYGDLWPVETIEIHEIS